VKHRHGDVVVRDRKDVCYVMVDDLLGPWIPLQQTNHFQFEVRGLPHPVFPDQVEFDLPHSQMTKVAEGWEATRIRIQYQTLSGEPFFEKTLAFPAITNALFESNMNGKAIHALLSDVQRRSLHSSKDYRIDVRLSRLAVQDHLRFRLINHTKIY